MAIYDKFVINFHETFAISRSSLYQILINSKQTGKLNRKFLAETILGINYQKAMPRYANRAGLLDEKNQLTAFGRYAAQSDPALEKPGTQWLLHYHLSAPHRPTAFWHFLVTRRFVPGNTFTAEDLVSDLKTFLQQVAGKEPAPRSVRSAVTVFIGSYLKSDGLKRLGLIEERGQGSYHIPDVNPPPVWALGYALAEYWQAHYGERLTVNLDDLTGARFAGLFLLGEIGLTNLLMQLKQEGLVDLFRISRPYQVVLLQPNPEFALERLYA
jgi:hypothetical protein